MKLLPFFVFTLIVVQSATAQRFSVAVNHSGVHSKFIGSSLVKKHGWTPSSSWELSFAPKRLKHTLFTLERGRFPVEIPIVPEKWKIFSLDQSGGANYALLAGYELWPKSFAKDKLSFSLFGRIGLNYMSSDLGAYIQAIQEQGEYIEVFFDSSSKFYGSLNPLARLKIKSKSENMCFVVHAGGRLARKQLMQVGVASYSPTSVFIEGNTGYTKGNSYQLGFGMEYNFSKKDKSNE